MPSLLNDIKKLKSRMVCRKVDDEMVLVPLVDNVAEMNVIYTLNEVAAFIWEKIDDVDTLEEIAEAVADNFDIDSKNAMEDINSFFEDIRNANI